MSESQRMPAKRAACLALAAMLAGCSAVSSRSSDRFVESGELIALSGGDAGAPHACFTCHGLDGRGNGAGAPRLAGLGVGYLDRQLEAYADGRRKDDMMNLIASRLSSQSRQAVSAYYSQMAFRSIPLPPPNAGALLYQFGDPERGLPACAACHGDRGQGLGAGNPPLAGQPALYLAEQMERWRNGKRRNDPLGVMLRISRLLTKQEAAALSAYAARLPGDPRNPEPPEAFRATHRDDPRSGA